MKYLVRHLKPEALQHAKHLAINLIQTIQSELPTYIQQQPPPVQPQQVIEQSQISQSMYLLSLICRMKINTLMKITVKYINYI